MTLGENGYHQGKQVKRAVPFYLLPFCWFRFSIREDRKLRERIESMNEYPFPQKHHR